ncbi:MAG TPA: LysM domain-containing protein [Candidatus Didemnitutus sp.]|nr:LysM domain-containing protein [Candidatus Didemnitutus sp.]
MLFRRFSLLSLLLAPALAVVLGLGGCGDGDRSAYASEADEPLYREAVSLEKTGRSAEALAAFLKVIDRRGDDAPESHLEAGLIYQQHINDPLSAIYHFKKYLTIRPNSPQAPLVKQRIDAAVREFARTLPAQPIENQFQRVDLIAAMDRLKIENDLLKQKIAELRAGNDVPDADASAPGPTAAPAPKEDLKVTFNVDNVPTVRTHAARPEPEVQTAPPPAPAPTRRTATAAPTRAAPATQTPPATRGQVRHHTVARGDTLSNLAQRYYNNRAKWHDIYAANRNVMKNEGDLRVGMELVIP